MGNSKIEWTDATWNPVVGCTKVSAGCAHCYAETMAKRLRAMALADIEAGKDPGKKRHYIDAVDEQGRWTGNLVEVPEAIHEPLRWKKPRLVFVCSMSDLFHESVPFEFIDQVFAVMAVASQHTYQVLTKRPDRMAEWFRSSWTVKSFNPLNGESGERTLKRSEAVQIRCNGLLHAGPGGRRIDHAYRATDNNWPLRNVWIGTSVENQATANERIPHLLNCPAAVRFLSMEPLLGAVEFSNFTHRPDWRERLGKGALEGIGWIIAGGESGYNARPSHPDWFRSLRDQCVAAGVPFFFKQWGGHSLHECQAGDTEKSILIVPGLPCSAHGQIKLFDPQTNQFVKPEKTAYVNDVFRVGNVIACPVGKKDAGRMLDEAEWNEMPEVCR